MAEARPWWASEGPVGEGIDPDEDPVAVHRAARLGMRPGDDPDEDPAASRPAARFGTHPDGDPDTLTGSRAAGAHGHAATPEEVCGVCPVCSAARLIGDTRPELLGHLMEAGRHLAAAVRSVLDTPPGARPDTPSGGEPQRGAGRVDVD